MADYFVWHGSAQDDGDATWNSSTLAYLDLDTCLAAVAAGSNVWVAHDHSKTYATGDITLNNSGTIAAPIIVTCINRTTGAHATTALEVSSGSLSTMEPFEGNVIYDGVSFDAADGAVNGSDSTCIFKNASYGLAAISGTDSLSLSVADCAMRWENILFDPSAAGNEINVGGGVLFTWDGGGIDAAATTITRLLDCISTGGCKVVLKNLDISKISSAIARVNTTMATGVVKLLLSGCKIPSAVPILESSSFSVPHEVIAHSCDNGNGYYYFEETYLEGQIKQATNVYRTNGSKYDGTNGYSAKMVSNANALDSKRPLRFKLAERWMNANPTITVETITAGVTLQNDEFWIEVEYPNSTTNALADIDRSSRQQVGYSGGSAPGTPANLTTSTEGWTEDLAGEVKQKVAVTISSGAAGAHTVWACLAKPSTTVYVDMKLTVA